MKTDYDTTVADIAGNVASGIVQLGGVIDDPKTHARTARIAASYARAIVDEVRRAELTAVVSDDIRRALRVVLIAAEYHWDRRPVRPYDPSKSDQLLSAIRLVQEWLR